LTLFLGFKHSIQPAFAKILGAFEIEEGTADYFSNFIFFSSSLNLWSERRLSTTGDTFLLRKK
jgi:hypothetical protein